MTPEPPATRAALDVLVAAILASPHNLVSRRARAELTTRHLPECVAVAAMVPDGTRHLVDIGSGGGLPGLVIAAARPEVHVTLIEATGKKARFLDATAAAMGVGVTVIHGRAEDPALRRRAGRFDVATARAVAPLDRLVGWALPLLRPGGRLLAIKGDRWQDELQAARPALRRSGGSFRGLAAGPSPPVGGPAPTVVVIERR